MSLNRRPEQRISDSSNTPPTLQFTRHVVSPVFPPVFRAVGDKPLVVAAVWLVLLVAFCFLPQPMEQDRLDDPKPPKPKVLWRPVRPWFAPGSRNR